jgi:hypothetical protein
MAKDGKGALPCPVLSMSNNGYRRETCFWLVLQSSLQHSEVKNLGLNIFFFKSLALGLTRGRRLSRHRDESDDGKKLPSVSKKKSHFSEKNAFRHHLLLLPASSIFSRHKRRLTRKLTQNNRSRCKKNGLFSPLEKKKKKLFHFSLFAVCHSLAASPPPWPTAPTRSTALALTGLPDEPTSIFWENCAR